MSPNPLSLKLSNRPAPSAHRGPPSPLPPGPTGSDVVAFAVRSFHPGYRSSSQVSELPLFIFQQGFFGGAGVSNILPACVLHLKVLCISVARVSAREEPRPPPRGQAVQLFLQSREGKSAGEPRSCRRGLGQNCQRCDHLPREAVVAGHETERLSLRRRSLESKLRASVEPG